jgi:hypothetical protein
LGNRSTGGPRDKSRNYEMGRFPILIVKTHYRVGAALQAPPQRGKSRNYEMGRLPDFDYEIS